MKKFDWQGFALTCLSTLILYLFLVFQGKMLPLSEILAGIIVAGTVALISTRTLTHKEAFKLANPLTIIGLAFYFTVPFFWQMAKSNIDMAYRIITKDINPGIIEAKTGLETDFGITLLANSITLTPGTLTVDLNKKNDLFIHWINIQKDKTKAYGKLLKWVKRVIE